MLPSLTDLETFEARIPGGIAAADEPRAQAVLDDASTLVRAEAGETWIVEDSDPAELDEVPDLIVTVVISAARRAFVNPDGVRSESIDGYQTAYASSSPDVYLTTNEKKLIRQAAGRSGLWTQPTTRLDDDSTEYLDVLPEGEHFPFRDLV